MLDVATHGAGVLLAGLALRDVFHTLFHPGGHGGLAGGLCRVTWSLLRRLGERGQVLAGPAGVLLTIAAWMVLLVLGLALVLLPLVPQDLVYARGSPTGPAFADAVYLAAVSVSTLGLGDVVVQDPLLRWLAPLGGLLGFGVLTAAITWITQVYPALGRRRSLALDVWAVLGEDRAADAAPPPEPLLREWTSRLAHVDVDLGQNTETFWFRESDQRLALGPCLSRLAAAARSA